jgi:hypothetical protein
MVLFSQEKSQIGWMFINENTIDLDKQLHFQGSGYLAFSTYALVYQGNPANRKKAFFYSTVIPPLIGLIKEFADPVFSYHDMFYNLGGTVFWSITADLLFANGARKKKKQNKAIEITNAFYD